MQGDNCTDSGKKLFAESERLSGKYAFGSSWL